MIGIAGIDEEVGELFFDSRRLFTFSTVKVSATTVINTSVKEIKWRRLALDRTMQIIDDSFEEFPGPQDRKLVAFVISRRDASRT